MTRREVLRWTLVGLLLTPVSLLTNTEMVGYYACHSRVEQAAPALTPAFDPVTMRCRATL